MARIPARAPQLLLPLQLDSHALGTLKEKACRPLTPLDSRVLGNPAVKGYEWEMRSPPLLFGWC